jgi:two-component system cell cycle sensor histidine kinase/response regulator CckA
MPTVNRQLERLSEPMIALDEPQTELQRLRAERDILRARYRELYDSLQVGDLTLDALGTILAANVAAASLLGRDPIELVGCKLIAFVTTADAEIFHSHTQQLLETATPATCDVTLQRPDGAAVGVALESRMTRTGEFRTALIEIHERRKQDHARRMQSVGAVAAGVAHDFSNLLTGILGFAESCLAQLEPEHGARGRLEEIMTAALTGATLVRRLMVVGQPTASSATPGHFDSVVRTLAPLLRRLVGEQVELRLDLAAEDGLVQCESGQIEQIVLNLVINARQAMPLGGRVDVHTAVVELSDRDAERAGLGQAAYVRLIVRDTGCGMDESTLKHALDPFYTTKAVGEGTGLGLSTVSSIVGEAAGRIELRSANGQGTEVTVLLPKHAHQQPVRRGDKHGKQAEPVETILLVEDEPLVRAAASDHLQKAGYRVLAASNGRDALLACENHNGRIDLLLTDMLLPAGLSGVRLARLIQTQAPGAAVAFMSAYPASALRSEGLLDQRADSLEKPFTRDELLRHVRAALKA